jgi:hypothetical protein
VSLFDCLGYILCRIATNRLENDIKIARHAELRAHGCLVALQGAEVVEDSGLAVKEWFDVDKLPGPACFLENGPTATEPTRS